VHRDLKLDNVFLIDNPDDPALPKVKLLDWGIAKVMSHDVRHTIEGQLVGTPQYLSPEQARGHDVTPKTDVYSLGVMAYELFLEQLPFEAETAAEVMAMHLRVPPPPPSELWPDVPPALQDLLLAMLAKSPDQRPTMVEVARRFEAVRGELQQRCHAHQTRRHSATPVDASEPGRVVSSAGLAATQPAWRLGRRRWQYALGASALAASAVLFWIGRTGDQIADAATLPAHASRASTAAHAVAGSLAGGVLAAPRAVAVAETDDASAEERPDAPSDAQPSRPTPAHVELASAASPPTARVAPARSPSLRPSAPRQTPPPSTPVAPRRGAKVDPDGTFAAY